MVLGASNLHIITLNIVSIEMKCYINKISSQSKYAQILQGWEPEREEGLRCTPKKYSLPVICHHIIL